LGQGTPSLEKALEQYSLAVVEATNLAPQMDSGLFVMTVHQAKGKEFDCVIVADASSRYWRDDEENRRLFYVALTRASKSWVIVAPDSNATPLLAYLK
jgi:superfamily I DNA/RNA helicase